MKTLNEHKFKPAHADHCCGILRVYDFEVSDYYPTKTAYDLPVYSPPFFHYYSFFLSGYVLT